MSLNKIRLLLLSLSMLLVLVVFGFIGAINMATFKQNYSESLASSYKVLADQTVRKIEYAVRYGKPLNNFQGIEELLSENLNKTRDFEEVQIVLPGGDIIYNQDGVVTNRQLSSMLKEKVIFYDNKSSLDVVYELDDKNYYVYSPIYDKEENWIASLGLVLNERVVTSEIDQYRFQVILYFFGISIIAFVGLLFFFYKVPLFNDTRVLLKNRVLVFVVVFLGLAQVSYCALNYYSLKNGYLEIVKEHTSMALSVIQSDIEQVISKGASYTDLHGVGEYMNEMITSIPEIARISIINADYTTETVNEELFTSKYSYSSQLVQDQTSQSTYIHVVDLSETYIDEKTNTILFDTITMLILSQLLIVEMTLFGLVYLENKLVKNERETNHTTSTSRLELERRFIRPIAFIVMTASSLSYAYLPIVIQQSFDQFFGLPHLLVAALPLSIEALFVIAAVLSGIKLCDRKGWRPVFLSGILILSIGTLGSAFSWDTLPFIMSRAVAGFGLGFALIALNRYTYNSISTSDNEVTFSEFQSGTLTGLYFGIIIGAMLAERSSLLHVYLLALPILVVALLLAFKYMPNYIGRRVYRRRLHFKLKKLGLHSIKNLKILSFIPLVILPISAANMFLFYFYPIYANDYGISITSIGRIFLIHCLLILFLKPIYSKYISKLISYKMSIIISALFILVGFIIFAVNETMVSIVVAVILIGLASAIGSSAQFEYYKNKAALFEFDEGKVVSYYMIFEFVSKFFAPLLFAICVLRLSDPIGVTLLGIIIFLATISYFLIEAKKTKIELDHNVGGILDE